MGAAGLEPACTTAGALQALAHSGKQRARVGGSQAGIVGFHHSLLYIWGGWRELNSRKRIHNPSPEPLGYNRHIISPMETERLELSTLCVQSRRATVAPHPQINYPLKEYGAGNNLPTTGPTLPFSMSTSQEQSQYKAARSVAQTGPPFLQSCRLYGKRRSFGRAA